MDMKEFVKMLKAIKEAEPVKVDFSLQWSSEGDLTLQTILEHIHIVSFYDFMVKVEKAEVPDYD